jgi:hypothetical protein
MGKPNTQGGDGSIKSIFALVAIVVLVFGGLYLYAVGQTGNKSPYAAVMYYLTTENDNVGDCLMSGTIDKSKECKLNNGKGGSGTNGQAGGQADKAVIVDTYTKRLEDIKIANPATDVAYNRAEWGVWSKLDGEKCNTRVQVLKAQGVNVVTKDGNPDSCAIAGGIWVSPYDGEITDVKKGEDTKPISKIQIDHVIPLKYAAAHGAKDWNQEKKVAFANDTTQLLATSGTSNTSKGAKGPAEYMPRESEQCRYSQIWIDTAKKYDISITKADKNKLAEGIATCGK